MVRLAATLALQTRMRLTMPSSPPAETRLPTPCPQFVDRSSAKRISTEIGLEEALCVSEAFSGVRCSVYYFYGRLEACWSLSGVDMLEQARPMLPKRLQQPLTIHVEGTISDSNHFIADNLVDADGDRFLALDRLAFLGFDTATAVCCATFTEVEWCLNRWRAGCFGRSELPTNGIVVHPSSASSPNGYAFAMN